MTWEKENAFTRRMQIFKSVSGKDGGKPPPYKWRFLDQIMEVKGEGILILVLRANSTLDQAAADLDNYGRKVDREFRKHNEWASRIGWSVYACHEEALSKATFVEDPQVRVYVIMGVMEE